VIDSVRFCFTEYLVFHFYHIFISGQFCFQVGEFYEAIGIDACILVEYAGLNPFGGLRSDSVPRAGCPVVVFFSSFPMIL
jgi:hypothetical protein